METGDHHVATVAYRHPPSEQASMPTPAHTTLSPPRGQKISEPHKFYLALGLPKSHWSSKDKRDAYKLATARAIQKASECTGIDLKRAWRTYPQKLRENFEDEFKNRLEKIEVPSRKVCRVYLQERCKEGAKQSRKARQASGSRQHRDGGEDGLSQPVLRSDVDFEDIAPLTTRPIHQLASVAPNRNQNSVPDDNMRYPGDHVNGGMPPASPGRERMQRSLDETTTLRHGRNIARSVHESPNIIVSSYTALLTGDSDSGSSQAEIVAPSDPPLPNRPSRHAEVEVLAFLLANMIVVFEHPLEGPAPGYGNSYLFPGEIGHRKTLTDPEDDKLAPSVERKTDLQEPIIILAERNRRGRFRIMERSEDFFLVFYVLDTCFVLFLYLSMSGFVGMRRARQDGQDMTGVWE